MAGRPATGQKEARKLNAEESEAMVERLYTKTIEKHQKALEKREKELYPTCAPVTLSPEKIDAHLSRLTETDIQKKKRETLEHKYYPDNPSKKISIDQVDESVARLYGSGSKKEVKLKHLEDKYAFKRKAHKVMSRDECNATFAKLAEPKKVDFSQSQYYGATHGT